MKTVTFKAQEEMTYKVALTICLSILKKIKVSPYSIQNTNLI